MTAPAESSEETVFALRDQVEILLVDDRAENLLALEAILEPLGQKLVTARSGEETLRKLLRHDFACVLLDVQMPGMNGFETAQLIKARERTRYIPIIFLTAISKEEDYVFRGYQMGAVDYISKPFQPDILRAKVAVFVDLHLKQKRLQEQESMLREGERRMTELRHMRELLQSEARFREILGTAMDAIVIFDQSNKVTMFNDAAERMFRCASSDAIGRDVSDFFAQPAGTSIQQIREDCSDRQGRESSGEPRSDAPHPVSSLSASRSNGETFPVEVSISCLDTKDGQQYTLIVRDVSERIRHEAALREQATQLERALSQLKRANDELNDRQEDLERAMTARSRFYASMSHELRTPINAVLGYSTLLLENIYGPLNEKQAEGIQRTQRAAKHLLELVNDVLDLSKIEAGKIDLRLQPVTFPTLVEELFVTVRPLADKFGSKLALDVAAPESITVVSDPRRVRQILLNLLSNAIKFGGAKPIRVHIERTADDGVTVAVIDQGEGIPRDDQERIFQEFVQLGKTQLQEGTGLGLPISRRLAELLHGSLVLESQEGAGSTFTLTLPANAELRAPRHPDQELAPRPVDERRRNQQAKASATASA